MGLNTNSSFIPSSCFCKDTMNPCKIQIFRYSFEGVTVLSLKGKCTYYPARCKRKRSQWNTRSLLPVALSERKLLDSLLPRALPWANFLLGFQPVFAACKPFIQGKTTEFQTKWGNGSNISHRCNGITRNDTAVSWKSVCGQHVRVLPWCPVVITKQFADVANNRNNTIPNLPKRANPFVSWLFAFRGFLNS